MPVHDQHRIRRQSNLAKAALNALLPPPRRKGIGTPRLMQCFVAPKSFYLKQDLNPFSRFCTPKPSKTAWQTDWLTGWQTGTSVAIVCIWCIRYRLKVRSLTKVYKTVYWRNIWRTQQLLLQTSGQSNLAKGPLNFFPSPLTMQRANFCPLPFFSS